MTSLHLHKPPKRKQDLLEMGGSDCKVWNALYAGEWQQIHGTHPECLAPPICACHRNGRCGCVQALNIWY